MDYMTDWGSSMQIPQEFDGSRFDGCGPSYNVCDRNCGGAIVDDGSSDDKDDINIDDIDLEDAEVQKY
ncbi:hypothetical protein OROMI_019858 [Orobanche minor]